jgi:hypothetical protein
MAQQVVYVVTDESIEHCTILAICTTAEKALGVVKEAFEKSRSVVRHELVYGVADNVHDKTQVWNLGKDGWGDWLQIEEIEVT